MFSLTLGSVLGHDGHGLSGILQGSGGLLVCGVVEVHAIHLKKHPQWGLRHGSPQGRVLSPLLYTIYTWLHSHTALPTQTRSGIWQSGDINNLNTKKTKVVVRDFHRVKADPPSDPRPLSSSSRPTFPRTCRGQLTQLPWSRKESPSAPPFPEGSETDQTRTDLLVHALPVWYAVCTVGNRRRLQTVTRTAEKVITLLGLCVCVCVRMWVHTDTSLSPFLSSPLRSAGPPARMKDMKMPSPSSPPTMLKPNPVAPLCSTTFLGSLLEQKAHSHPSI